MAHVPQTTVKRMRCSAKKGKENFSNHDGNDKENVTRESEVVQSLNPSILRSVCILTHRVRNLQCWQDMQNTAL